MATTPKTLTYEEWLEMPVAQDAIEEVVNGEIRIIPPNLITHARVVRKLNRALEGQIDEKVVEIFASVFGLVIRRDPLICRIPDLALFEKATLVELDGYIHSAPQLAIEVLSPSETRSEITAKLTDYEKIGAPEVWLVSPEARVIEVLVMENGRLRTKMLANQGKLSPSRFANIAIDVTSIWPD